MPGKVDGDGDTRVTPSGRLCGCNAALSRNEGKRPERQSPQPPCSRLLEQEQRFAKS